MASQGENLPITVGIDTSIGTRNWSYTTNVLTENGSSAKAVVGVQYGGTCNFYSIKLIKNNIIIGDNKATGTVNATLTNYYFGGENDLWGENITPDDVNNNNFGVAVSFNGTGWNDDSYITYYLKTTNFGFNIPSDNNIVGIKVRIKAFMQLAPISCNSLIDVVGITVYYTEAQSPPVHGALPFSQSNKLSFNSNGKIIWLGESVDTNVKPPVPMPS